MRVLRSSGGAAEEARGVHAELPTRRHPICRVLAAVRTGPQGVIEHRENGLEVAQDVGLHAAERGEALPHETFLQVAEVVRAQGEVVREVRAPRAMHRMDALDRRVCCPLCGDRFAAQGGDLGAEELQALRALRVRAPIDTLPPTRPTVVGPGERTASRGRPDAQAPEMSRESVPGSEVEPPQRLRVECDDDRGQRHQYGADRRGQDEAERCEHPAASGTERRL